MALCDFPEWSAAEAADCPFGPMCLCSPSPDTYTSRQTVPMPVLISQAHPCLCWLLRPLLEASGGWQFCSSFHCNLPPPWQRGFPGCQSPTLITMFPSAEHPHRSHCSRCCAKSSKQDRKMGIVSFKLQTHENWASENGVSILGSEIRSALDLSYSKAVHPAFLSWISPAMKPVLVYL